MKRQTIMTAALLFAAAAAFAENETTFKVSGVLRAGLSSSIGENSQLTTKTWVGGTYFNSASSKTRSRLNLNFDGKNDSAKYGAFMRLQYDAGDALGAKNWTLGTVKYADAYVGLANNMVTIVAGKMKDNWICSTGIIGYSVLDGTSGVAVNITPVNGLNILGAAVIDNTNTTYDLSGDAFLGGVKYKNDTFNAMVSYAGWGVLAANASFTGVKNLTLAVEGEYETVHGLEKVGGQAVLADEWIQYTGVERWTFGLLASQVYNSKTISADNDFAYVITPAVAFALNDVVALQLEASWQQSIYDNAPAGYATFVPSVKLSADKSAYATVWTSISTDTAQSANCVGVGVTKEF